MIGTRLQGCSERPVDADVDECKVTERGFDGAADVRVTAASNCPVDEAYIWLLIRQCREIVMDGSTASCYSTESP